ncbi:roundabout 2, partial [Biomphalaria pfeifferi]
WTHFRNKSELVGEETKFTFYDPMKKVAYINTFVMSEAEYDSVGGDYVVNIAHLYDYRIEHIHVTLKDKPALDDISGQSKFLPRIYFYFLTRAKYTK